MKEKGLGVLHTDKTPFEFARIFALYLSKNPDVKLRINGTALCPSDFFNVVFQHTLHPFRDSRGKEYQVQIEILDWEQSVERGISLCDSAGIELHSLDAKLRAKGLNFTIQLKCDYFAELAKEVNFIYTNQGDRDAADVAVKQKADSVIAIAFDLAKPEATRLKGYQVDFENDANAAEIAERPSLHGNSTFLSLSNTVGGSIAFGRTMYLGDNRRAGEFGHVILHPDGRRCYCGKRGCADAYLSALRLAENASSLEDFFARLESGEKKMLKAWNAYLDDLAVLVSNLRMACDCPVVIGGYVGALMEPHLVELRKRAAALDLFGGDPDWIRVSRCGREASAIGAALMMRDALAARL